MAGYTYHKGLGGFVDLGCLCLTAGSKSEVFSQC